MLKASPSQGPDTAAQRLHFGKGEPIYFEGDPAPAWFAVAEGVVRTCRFDADGQRQLTGFHYAGDAFGLDEGVRLESAEAVTWLSLLSLRKPGGPAEDVAGAAGGVMETALRNALANANRSIFLHGRRTAPQRLAAFLLMTAERQGRREEVDLAMSRTDIADYLGLTIHTVSRTLTQLCRDRIIALEGAQHCVILDLPGLRRLAGGEDPPVVSSAG